MAKKPTRAALSHLRAFGHTTEDDDGGLVRHRGTSPRERFIPTDGGYFYDRWEDGDWSRKPHHVNVGPNGEHVPEYLWPEAHVEHVYRAATDAEYHEQIQRDGIVWDVARGELGRREG